MASWPCERAPRTICIDVADEIDVLEVGNRAAAFLAHRYKEYGAFRIFTPVMSWGSTWTD